MSDPGFNSMVDKVGPAALTRMPTHQLQQGECQPEVCTVTRADYIADISKFPASWEHDWHGPEWLFSFEKKLADLVNPDGRPMICAHRGDIEAYPENSIEAVISAVLKGADMIELDCALTSDGVLVLNHGENLSPTTDWKEKRGTWVEGVLLPESAYTYDWSYAQLSRLRLRTGSGGYSSESYPISGYRIATLEEAIRVCRKRCFLSLDRLQYDLTTGRLLPPDQMGINNPYWPQIHEKIHQYQAPQCILYTNMALTQDSANEMRRIIEAEFGIFSPTQFDRAGWHNVIVDWYAEFSLSQEAEFDHFYQVQLRRKAGNYLMVNRLREAIHWLDKTVPEGNRIYGH